MANCLKKKNLTRKEKTCQEKILLKNLQNSVPTSFKKFEFFVFLVTRENNGVRKRMQQKFKIVCREKKSVKENRFS